MLFGCICRKWEIRAWEISFLLKMVDNGVPDDVRSLAPFLSSVAIKCGCKGRVQKSDGDAGSGLVGF